MPSPLRRAGVPVLCAALVALAGCGGDDEEATVETAPPAPPPAAGERLWPPPGQATGDPLDAARSFVADYIGVDEPALSELREPEPGTGEIDVHRRGEDGRRLDAVVSTLSLREDDGQWFVTAARSAEVEVAVPRPLAEIASPVRVRGTGRGFEGNIVLEVREAYATEPLVQEPVTAGSLERREPFSTRLDFDPGDATAGAVVALTGSGLAVADGFAAFPVSFTRD